MVSIVIPTYNQAYYITDTLKSVLNQTYENLEIIVSDDYSTDGTIDVLKEYAKKDNRIKLLLSKKNLGISGNFNKAFDSCTGEFIAFLGGDDLMEPTKIEKQVAFLNNNVGYALCMHDMIIYNEKTKLKFKHSEKYLASTNPLDWCLYSNWYFNKKIVGVLPSSCLARADYYLSARYDTRLKYKHELLFHLDIYCNQPKMKWGYLNEVLGLYRIHETNFSSSKANISQIPEDSNVYYAIASYKYPNLARQIKSSKDFTWFNQLLYDWLPIEKRRNYFDQFRIEAGILKYTYLRICIVLLKFGLLFIISKPFRLLTNK